MSDELPQDIKDLAEEEQDNLVSQESFSDVLKDIEFEFKKRKVNKFRFCYPTLCVIWDGEKIHFELAKGGEVDISNDEYLISVASIMLSFILSHVDDFKKRESMSWKKYV